MTLLKVLVIRVGFSLGIASTELGQLARDKVPWVWGWGWGTKLKIVVSLCCNLNRICTIQENFGTDILKKSKIEEKV